ncbi:unnamed protein product [Rotaria magnacalcarata]|uniref:PID domain-containing protein n=1 Tax=Rotaria magnacalcarata TaxID=392030 RepID=A0A815TBI6_9BILA|nr:unnamed protein product [Rotaria magnacalcarata]
MLQREKQQPSQCAHMLCATSVPVSTSKKLVEPFYRLKNRANLFRRKHYSSHLDISENCSILSGDYSNRSDKKKITNNINNSNHNNVVLKRSNSMICPQQRLQSFLRSNNNNKKDPNYRNSISVELTGCLMDESSTDDYYPVKSPSDYYWSSKMRSTMSNIKEQDVYPSQESIDENKNEAVSLHSNNNHEETTAIVSSPSIIKSVMSSEQNQPLISSISTSSSTLVSRDNSELILSSFLGKRQSTCSSRDESFYDCKQGISCFKSTQIRDVSASKMSTCTMTGKSLNNLDQCLTIMSADDKHVQTVVNDSTTLNLDVVRNDSSATLSSSSSSSSSTSIQTDSLENKPNILKISETSKNSINQRLIESYYKWPHIYERLLSEDTCIYWVNYLGSTAIKISTDDVSTIPTHAINRLKQSTQYARILPIIGLSISPRGVEFLKHSKDRVAICFHDMKSIHCAFQGQDLRYFAYVAHEQRTTFDLKQKVTSSPFAVPKNADHHSYCHVFVVKSEAMSTEILLTFGQAFDVAYRRHHRSNSKQIYTDESRPNTDGNRLSSQFNKMMSSSAHSPATSSSSSLSNEERRNFL